MKRMIVFGVFAAGMLAGCAGQQHEEPTVVRETNSGMPVPTAHAVVVRAAWTIGPIPQPECVVRLTNLSADVARLNVTVAAETATDVLWSTQMNVSNVPPGLSAEMDSHGPGSTTAAPGTPFTCRLTDPYAQPEVDARQ